VKARLVTGALIGCIATAWPMAGLAAQVPAGRAAAPRQPASALPRGGTLAEAERALNAGDDEKALALAERHAGAHPQDAAARVIAARVHMARADLDRAYEQLRRALAAQPRHVDALYYMGLVSGRLAERELERLAEVAPDSARLQQVLAESYELQDRRHDAAAAYEAALRRDPSLLDALLGLAKLRRIALQCEEAVKLYERAEAVRPTYEAAYGLGVCHSFELDDQRAERRFRQALERDPKAPLAWLGLGMSAAKLGRTPEAIAHLQRAIALEPRLREAHYALGQAYQRSGDAARAQAAFDEASRLQAGSPPPREPR
jgi:tetratricopeptide (TPR) repeat protein